MTRRRHLCSLLALLLAAGPVATIAAAQEAGRAAGTPAPAAPNRARKRRRARRRNPAEGAQRQQQQQEAAPAPPGPEPEPRLEAAPVPNRDLEAPRVVEADRARLSPSVIHRPLPGQGVAADGAPSIEEERLFFPAPGARLKVPFAY